MSSRPETALLVSAALRHANSQQVQMVLVRRGAATAGSVLVRLDLADGRCRLEGRVLDLEGKYRWRNLLNEDSLPADEVEARLEREYRYDPDCWVIAIDSPDGVNTLAMLEEELMEGV